MLKEEANVLLTEYQWSQIKVNQAMIYQKFLKKYLLRLLSISNENHVTSSMLLLSVKFYFEQKSTI